MFQMCIGASPAGINTRHSTICCMSHMLFKGQMDSHIINPYSLLSPDVAETVTVENEHEFDSSTLSEKGHRLQLYSLGFLSFKIRNLTLPQLMLAYN